MVFRAFLNDLSVEGFPTADAVTGVLKELVASRRLSPNLARALYCSKGTAMLKGQSGQPLIGAIQELPRDEKAAVLQWLGRAGPFIEDDLTDVADNLYYHASHDVTDQGLGEAARQVQVGSNPISFSLSHRNDLDFSSDQLDVLHGLMEAPFEQVGVPNTNNIAELIRVANSSVPEPVSWSELILYCRNRFSSLTIGGHCEEVLRPLPFYPIASRRIIELLTVLNQMGSEIGTDGSLTAEGEQLKQKYFVGAKAWFTDEAPGNKRDFATEMNFPDPIHSGETLQCFWHGKIKTPQFRIHFQWPLEAGSTVIKVPYIGPKISKR